LNEDCVNVRFVNEKMPPESTSLAEVETVRDDDERRGGGVTLGGDDRAQQSDGDYADQTSQNAYEDAVVAADRVDADAVAPVAVYDIRACPSLAGARVQRLGPSRVLFPSPSALSLPFLRHIVFFIYGCRIGMMTLSPVTIANH
jgi:hypothetical protein